MSQPVLASYMTFSILIVAEQLSAMHGAVKMLHTRVRLIVDYLKAVQSGLDLEHMYMLPFSLYTHHVLYMHYYCIVLIASETMSVHTCMLIIMT